MLPHRLPCVSIPLVAGVIAKSTIAFNAFDSAGMVLLARHSTCAFEAYCDSHKR